MLPKMALRYLKLLEIELKPNVVLLQGHNLMVIPVRTLPRTY